MKWPKFSEGAGAIMTLMTAAQKGTRGMIKSTCPKCGMVYEADMPIQCPCVMVLPIARPPECTCMKITTSGCPIHGPVLNLCTYAVMEVKQ